MKNKLWLALTVILISLSVCACGTGIDNSTGGGTDGKLQIFNINLSDKADLKFSDKYLIGFDYSDYSSVNYYMSKIITCRVCYDKSLEADFSWHDEESGEDVTRTMVFDLSDEQYGNIIGAVEPKEIYSLDPKCSDFDVVNDGGYSYLFLYGSDDNVLKNVGGFCPTSKKFSEIRRVLFDNLPSDLDSVFARYAAQGYLDDDIEKLIGAGRDCSDVENQMKILLHDIGDDVLGRIQYYTVADLNDNGRVEFLYSCDDAVNVYEVSEDYVSIKDCGRMNMYVFGEGPMGIRTYLQGDCMYFLSGYNKAGEKTVTMFMGYDDAQIQDMLLTGNDVNFIYEEDGRIRVTCDEDYYRDISKEYEVIRYAGKPQLKTINWNVRDESLDEDKLIEIFTGNQSEVIEEMDEIDALKAFTGDRVYFENE